MRFGPVPVEEAEGAVLAHGVTGGGLAFKKGRVLTAADQASLRAQGIESVIAARMERGDVAEDEAAAGLAACFAGPGIRVDEPFTGRVNLFAETAGLLLIDTAGILRLNGCHEAITVATLAPWTPVVPGQMLATIKIIPFAVPGAALDAAIGAARGAGLVRLAAYTQKRVRLIQTELPATSGKMLDKTVRVTAERIAACGGGLLGEERCAHEPGALAAAISRAQGAGFDILLVAGASAITDRRDVLPQGLEAAGGAVVHLGMPVDPGNLLLLGRLGGAPVLGLPGCARSPKLNGFDWVLQRLAADVPVGPADIVAMGVGGLLMEIPTRPQPREQAPREPAPEQPRIAAVLLAAGRSSRMGERNKLLIPVEGKPMVRHAAEAALAAHVRELVVVTGHMAGEVAAALEGLPVRLIHNPDYAQGLSSSLKAGIGALGRKVDGAIVMLGDMPRIGAEHLTRLTAAFAPAQGKTIVVPTVDGKRGNPVLWGRAHFDAFRAIEGDVGARHLIGANEAALVEVAMPDGASLLDVDTPAALDALRAGELT